MRIAILTLDEIHRTGISDVTVETVEKMQEIDCNNEYVYLGSATWMEGVIKKAPCLSNYGRTYFNMNFAAVALGIDLIHSYYPPINISNRNVKRILTIHDLYGLHSECRVDNSCYEFYNNELKHSAWNADRIVTVSEYTKNDIVDKYNISPEKIKVIYPGVSERFSGVSSDELPELKSKEYIVMVSSLIYRKNMLGLAKAFSLYKERHPKSELKLVLAGGNRRGVVNEIRNAGCLLEDILFVGYVTDSQLKWMYEHALAVAYTSLFEGFGLPILEGMSMGKAVISSDKSSMPEVGGDAVCYCDPYSIESIACAIERVTLDGSFRQELEIKGLERSALFSYEKSAQQTLDLYSEVL